MVGLSCFIFIVFAIGVLSEESLLTPCEIQDTQCLSKTTQEFLEKTSNGIPQYDIRAIDPLNIPSIDYVLIENPEAKMHLKNIKVVGLKNQQFSQFKMDRDTKTVDLQTKVDIKADGDLLVELGNGKTFSGPYSIKGTVLGTAKYGYDFKVDEKGVEHYEVGPETITCQAVGEPTVTVGPELEKELSNDKDITDMRRNYASKSKELREKEICEIVNRAYVTVVHNIRASAKILPKSAFLKGV
ncbi:juvenile hormone-binding protein-like [Aricia agestis]|uniref:juvenile hormone-binding protein-like n=1 Tax=Aricia agestis TaxID=91739 RepID=UPI001C207954|nr:juvenile hormone-binding protein-like [Aricia agestis]XP_041979954.1 juvenile hormone-binding protein-like [Aricia agestis]